MQDRETLPPLKHLEEAERRIRISDHLAYVTFPIVNDKKLLLKILSETNLGVLNCINAILQYEYIQKKISLSKDAKTNLRTFTEQCSVKYGLSPEKMKKILELISLAEKHKSSPMEFVRKDKVVILSKSSENPELTQIETVTISKIKEFLEISKNFLKKTKSTFHNKV